MIGKKMMGATIAELSNEVRLEVRQIVQQHEHVVAHRAKLGDLCNQMGEFEKILNRTDFSSREAGQTEIDNFRALIDNLRSLSKILSSLSADKWRQTISLTFRDDFIKQLQVLCSSFNMYTTELHLLSDGFFSADGHRARSSDRQDCETMLQLLAEDKDLSESLGLVYTEYQRALSTYNMEDAELVEECYRPISEDEAKEQLWQFKSMIRSNDNFKNQSRIGRGAFSDVYLAYELSTGRFVAKKEMSGEKLTEDVLKMFIREVKIMSKLDSFAVLPFIGITDTHPYSILTEYMPGGTLFKRLHMNPAPLSATNLTIIAFGIALGMEYLHSQNMIHRDLKSLNILLDADGFPKISDFGGGRESNSVKQMTCQSGTIEWMAPEVLLSDNYNEKVDVYSYGIILWELLTKDIPFRGLKDVQISLAVLNQNQRPLIPPSCPPKLGKLIRVCWDRNPDKRPSFKDICRAFENGDIAFPGTNIAEVEAYKSIFKGKKRGVSSIFVSENKVITEEVVIRALSKFCNGNASNQASSLMILKEVVLHGQYVDIFKQYAFVDQMIKFIDKISNITDAECMTELVNNAMSVPEYRTLLKRPDFTESALILFMKFGTTSQSCNLNIPQLLSLENVSLNIKNLQKLAAFLMAPDLSVRISITKCLSTIVDNKAYDNEAALNVVVYDVLANISNDGMPELVRESLVLLEKLIQLPCPLLQANKSDGPSVILEICRSKDEEMVKTGYRLLEIMVKEAVATPKFVAAFIDVFGELTEKNVAMTPLVILGHLTRSPSVYKQIASDSAAVMSFDRYLSSSDPAIVMNTLKILYVFLLNEISCTSFVTLTSKLMDTLAHPEPNIGVLVLANLCRMYSIIDDKNELLTDVLAQFMTDHLTVDGTYGEMLLRLFGVIATSCDGSIWLEMNNITALLKPFLGVKDRFNHTIMALTNASASFPSDSIVDMVDAVMDHFDGETVVLDLMANVAVHPRGAILCVKYLDQFIGVMETQTKNVLTIMNRIVTDPESLRALDNENMIKQFLAISLKLWETEYAGPIFEMYDTMLACVPVRNVFVSDGFPEMIRAMMQLLPVTSSRGAIFARIMSHFD